MRDPELIKLRNRFLIEALIVLVFLIPIIFIFINKFDAGTPKIIKKIDKEETITVFVTNPECKNCKEVENILSENNVNYYKLDTSKKTVYNKFLNKLSITNKEIVVPTLMYIEEGKLYATLVDIKDEEELNEFINYYNLNK